MADSTVDISDTLGTIQKLLRIVDNGDGTFSVGAGLTDVAVITGANTGVKGLRVYGGPTDPISDIPVMIDYPHHQLHEGETWQYFYGPAVIAQNAVLNYRIVVGDVTPTTRTPHAVAELDTNGEVWLELFELPTFSAPGTAATFFNRNRNVAGSPTTTIFTTPTVTATGTKLSGWIIGSGQKAGNATKDSIEWDLKANTEYLYRITAQVASNICFRIIQYEDKGA